MAQQSPITDPLAAMAAIDVRLGIPPFPTDLRPLPDCDGPKREAFTDDLMAMNIEFLDPFVGDENMDSVIAKVKIDEKVYCLKMFQNESSSVFIEPMPYEPELQNKSEAVKELMRVHTTPFYNECRAFGRLKELGLEHLAVKVHGYAVLYPNDKLTEQGRAWLARNKPGTDNKYFTAAEYLWRRTGVAEHDKRPVMCIIKDWVDAPPSWPMTKEEEKDSLLADHERFPRLLEELHQLHKCGIVNRDLSSVQYVNGVLVDLSRAWTIPHVLGPGGGAHWPSWAFASMAAGDLQRFQDLVIDDYNVRAQCFNQRHGLRAADRVPTSRLRAVPSVALDGIIGRLRRLPHREAHNLAWGTQISDPIELVPRWIARPQGLDVQGPLFPLLTDDGEPSRSFIHWPRHDPAKFDCKAVTGGMERDGDKVAEKKARQTGPVASKRVTKRRSGAAKRETSRRRR